jgi:anti-anti-sigma factor
MERNAEVVALDVPGTTVLELRGNVDRDLADELTAAYERGSALQGSHTPVVLDFSAADYINSSGIALVVSILARARTEGRSVAATGLSDHYRHIFEITRLSDFIEVCDDLDSALARQAAGAS